MNSGLSQLESSLMAAPRLGYGTNRQADIANISDLLLQYFPQESKPVGNLNVPSLFDALGVSSASSNKYGLDELPPSTQGFEGLDDMLDINQQNSMFSLSNSLGLNVPGTMQDGMYSPFFFQTPASVSRFHSSPTVSPKDIHLNIPRGYAPMHDEPSSSTADFSSPFSSSPSPLTPATKRDGLSPCRNALGLFDQYSLLNTTLPNQDVHFPPPPRLSFDGNALISSVDDGTSQLFLGTGSNVSLFPDTFLDLGDTKKGNSLELSTKPVLDGHKWRLDCPSSSDIKTRRLARVREYLYPSPSPTPERPAISLPRRSCSGKASSSGCTRTRRPIRAAASRRKSYREVSESPSPFLSASASIPSHDSACLPSGSGDSDDVCEYGFRIWESDKKGGHVSKWKCRHCATTTGRRPDLHRHFKTCVKREKFYCIDVFHTDGSKWPGCGMMFSRRDACHRHLKKRFTEGRCSKTKPKRASCSDDEYNEKVARYQDMLTRAQPRSKLPASEKNRLVRSALDHIKQDMF